jgi:hypothetical protein
MNGGDGQDYFFFTTAFNDIPVEKLVWQFRSPHRFVPRVGHADFRTKATLYQ